MTKAPLSDRVSTCVLVVGSIGLFGVAAYIALRHNNLNLMWLSFAVGTLMVLTLRAWSKAWQRRIQASLALAAFIISVLLPLPLTTIGLQVAYPARSVEVVTGTLGVVHRKDKISGWTTRGIANSPITFLRRSALEWDTPTQFVTFGHRNGSYVIDEIWFGTDILRLPLKLASLRGPTLLKSAHLPATTGSLTPEGAGYRVVNRTEANPIFRLKADRAFVSRYIQRRREWPIRFLWFIAFIAVIVVGSVVQLRRFAHAAEVDQGRPST